MPWSPNGEFTFIIKPAELAKGLRWTRRNSRNEKFLTECYGAVGYDNVLQALEDITGDWIDTSALAEAAFPFPQLFVFTNLIVIATQTKIYEVDPVAKTLTEKLTVAEGVLWSAVDFGEFVYMSNGVVAVTRSATSMVWATTTDVPVCGAMCNFNGQVVIGSADVIQVAL